MATQSSEKRIPSIVIDTGPLIKNTVSISTIIASAEKLYTTPAIISEIRDTTTRSRVETTLLPFLNIRTPSPASYDAVVAFSKKTGDYSVLSRQDLGILALAYEVHCEQRGGPWGLRNAPGAPFNEKPKDENEENGTLEGNPELQAPFSEKIPVDYAPSASNEDTALEAKLTPGDIADQSVHPVQEPVEQEAQGHRPLIENQVPSTSTENALETVSTTVEEDFSSLQISDASQSTQLETPPASEEDDNSDGGEWITPSNLKKHQSKKSGNNSLASHEPQISVATMTTDFAMQNVLLQMHLPLLSTNMQRIKSVRTQVLRCHACFFTTKEMSKQFCPRCGQPTLNRVNCHTNSKGEFRLHLAKNFQYNKRGDRYSIPKPVAGTSSGKHVSKGGGKNGWGKELVLAEDQKEYSRQIDAGKRSKARDLMDEDYLPSILSGDRGRAGGRPKVGAGKNVNSRKRF